MSLTIESEKRNRMSFLNVLIIREDKTFTTSISFLNLQIIREDKYLPLLSPANLPLLEFIHVLTAFYHLTIGFVWYTHSLIDASEYAQVGVNYRMN